MLEYILSTSAPIIKFRDIANAVGSTETAVRSILRRLQALDYLSFRKARDGNIQGIEITLHEAISRPQQQPYSRYAPIPSTGNHNVRTPNIAKHSDRNAIQHKLLHLNDDDINFHWANIYRIGLRQTHIQHIVERLNEVEKSCYRVFLALDHADFALSQANTTHSTDDTDDNASNTLTDIIHTIAKNGYYTRPDGYISPEERAELDAAEEARRLARARQAREDAEFDL